MLNDLYQWGVLFAGFPFSSSEELNPHANMSAILHIEFKCILQLLFAVSQKCATKTLMSRMVISKTFFVLVFYKMLINTKLPFYRNISILFSV